MNRLLVSLACTASLGVAAPSFSDETAPPPVESKHQMMKDCMAKQKASDSGMPKEDMKKTCRDVTNNEHDNAEADKDASARAPTEDAPAAQTPPKNQ